MTCLSSAAALRRNLLRLLPATNCGKAARQSVCLCTNPACVDLADYFSVLKQAPLFSNHQINYLHATALSTATSDFNSSNLNGGASGYLVFINGIATL
jgi:hypothetical protein